MSTTVAVQVGQLARRSIVRTARQPASIFPALIFPVLLLAVNTGGLQSATGIPGFPTDSYLDFFIAFSFIQGATFGTFNSGSDLAKDIQTGFLSRLSLTPVRGWTLLAGHLGGAAAMGVFQAVVYMTVGLIAGVSIASGVGGALVVLALATTVATGFGAVGALLALRTGSGEAIQGFFPLFFVLLFLSSMALPRDLIENDWFRTIATYNPVSYLIEAVRSLFIEGWNAEALALGFAFALGILVVGLAGAAFMLRRRLTRT